MLPVQAEPKKTRVCAPTFDSITAADRPDDAPADPITIPPISTSGGEIVR
jgi:hypothetical protein